MIDRFTRSRWLFGDDFTLISGTKVCVFGVGGVGSFVVDSLYRSGITNITMIDRDSFDITNQNRQIGSQNVGEIKVAVLENLYSGTKGIYASVTQELLDGLGDFDYYVDAIDDIEAKILLARNFAHLPYGRYITSTGSGKKLNPLMIKVDNIFNTYGDRFAKKFKEALKKQNLKYNFKAIFSDEAPKCKALGSCEVVTASFGLQIASEILRHIIENKSKNGGQNGQ